VPGFEAGRVDHRVPLAILERAHVTAAVAHAVLDAVRHRVHAAREDRHVVAARERCFDHVPSEEHRPAEDQESHTCNLAVARGALRLGRRLGTDCRARSVRFGQFAAYRAAN
jgi:hypothetical protein